MNLLQNQKLNNKKAIIRVDLNVPLNEKKDVTDYTRIEAIKETVNFVINNGGSCILISHLGRPKGKDEKLSLKNILDPVSKTLEKPVIFFQDCIGEEAEQATKKLQPGEIILMENIRFYKEETEGDKLFAKKLSRLGDLYINDAFGTCHREHASTSVIAKYFPNDKYVGKLLQKELEAINQIAEHGEKPVLAILGGAKVSSKLNILYNLIKKVDKIIIGGGMAYTFIAAHGGKIGESLIEEDLIENAKEILEIANRLNKEIILPDDVKASTDFDHNDLIKIFDSSKIENGWMGLDIGPKTIEKFNQAILSSKTIFWNGPVGVFEMSSFEDGTKMIAQAIVEATEKGAYSLIGGGDSAAAVNKFKFQDQVSYISTGGGALLEFLEGKTLPGIAAIQD